MKRLLSLLLVSPPLVLALALPAAAATLDATQFAKSVAIAVGSGKYSGGALADFEQGRALVRDSIEMTRWSPAGPAAWDDAFPRWLAAKQRAAGVL